MLSDEDFSMADASALLSVPIPTLRTWEARYGIGASRRSPGGHRRFTRGDITRLRAFRDQIHMGRRPKDAAKERSLAVRGGPSRSIERFMAAAQVFDGTQLQLVLDDASSAYGVETTLTEVALPAMRMIGQSWADGATDVAQEHFATKSLTSWLSLVPHEEGTRGPILTACGPEEQHSLGLDAYVSLLKLKGFQVKHLGAAVPADSVLLAIGLTNPLAVVIAAQMRSNLRATAALLRRVHKTYEVTLFYAGAAFAAPSTRRTLPGIYLGDDLPAGVRTISQIA